MLATREGDGITAPGSLQCPYYVDAALARLLGLRPHRVRVLQAEIGSGFGGKEDYPSVIAGHAALLAWKARRPVKLVYDRVEDIALSGAVYATTTCTRPRPTPKAPLSGGSAASSHLPSGASASVA